MQKIKNLNYITVLLIIYYLFFYQLAFCKNLISDKLYPSKKDKLLFEVSDIRFEGNHSFTAFELIDAVSSKKNSLSVQHDLFQYYFDNLNMIPISPKIIKNSLKTALNNLSHEIKYFNEGTAELDNQTLWHFYNTNGFHFAEVSYKFLPDEKEQVNILTFIINENQRFNIDTVLYLGLDDIDLVVLDRIKSVKNIRKNDVYSEKKIMTEVNDILNTLLNNGYYYATVEVLPVEINKTKLSDSITVSFKPGKRQKITNLKFVDSTMDQFPVIDNMKKLQLDFAVGDWYSRRNIQSSINNLHTLGTFDLVSIDTNNNFQNNSDSTLSMVVFTKYRKQKEWGVGLFINNTQNDNFTNVGIEANLMHRNWGGAAQSGNIFANARAKNVSRILAGQTGEFEGQIGMRLAQPLIWSIENMKIGATGSFYYSLSTVDQLFNISAWFFPIRFPIKLTNDTYLNQIIVDFNFEFQNPTNYLDVIRDTISGITPRFLQGLLLYQNLYDYLNSPQTILLTSNLFGITLIGDSRNHPFSPTKGDFFNFSLDGWNIFLSHPWISGIAKFIRVQSSYNLFLDMNSGSVSAFKIRAGLINMADDYDSYVPFDRQFFAGGANSVRGWLSRELHYSTKESSDELAGKDFSDDILDSKSYTLLSNVLGSSAIIEGSYEFRYTFQRPKGIDEVLAEQISKVGITFFIDFGNAFHWYAEANNPSVMKWYEYLTKLAWACGFGFRYDTPIGPVRLDFGFPIYRPGYNLPDYKIWSNSSILNDMKLHFGIGHSF